MAQALREGLAQDIDPEFAKRRISFGQLARLDFLMHEVGEQLPAGLRALVAVAREVTLWWSLGDAPCCVTGPSG